MITANNMLTDSKMVSASAVIVFEVITFLCTVVLSGFFSYQVSQQVRDFLKFQRPTGSNLARNLKRCRT